jgi:hypothetical protein
VDLRVDRDCTMDDFWKPEAHGVADVSKFDHDLLLMLERIPDAPSGLSTDMGLRRFRILNA